MKISTIIFACIVLFILGWNNLFISEENREIEPFNSIFVTGPINVFVQKAEKEGVIVRADDGIHDHVAILVKDGQLNIYDDSHIHRERVLDVYVTYINLDSIHTSGASSITSRGIINTTSLMVHADGASEVKLQVSTDSLGLLMTKNANVRLAGETDNFDLMINHVGDLMAYNLLSQHCRAVLDTKDQSPGIARINVSQSIDVSINGPRMLKYKGNPRIINQELKRGGKLSRH